MERLFYRDAIAIKIDAPVELHNLSCTFCDSRLLTGSDYYEFGSKYRHEMTLQYHFCPRCGWWDTGYYEYEPDFWAGPDEHWEYLRSILTDLYIGDEIGDACRSLMKDVALHPDRLYELPPRQVEAIIGAIFRSVLDCSVALTQSTRDGGKDLSGFDSERGPFIIEVKRYGASKAVDVSVVRSLLGVMVLDGVQQGYVVTTSRFTKDAIAISKQLRDRHDVLELELKDYDDIKAWLHLGFDKYFDVERIKSRIRDLIEGSSFVSYPIDGFPTQ